MLTLISFWLLLNLFNVTVSVIFGITVAVWAYWYVRQLSKGGK